MSWLTAQIPDRGTTIAIIVPAGTAAQADLHHGHRLWPHIQSQAAG